MKKQAVEAPNRGASEQMADMISWLLIIGVSLAAVVLAIGLAYLMIRGRTGYHEAVDPGLIVGRAGSIPFPTTVGDVIAGVIALKPFAIIELGALLLIATPVFRVGASIILFLAERDYLYTVITLMVFVILVSSIFFIR